MNPDPPVPVLLDPDVDAVTAGGDLRPLHLRPRYLYVVFVGGVLGTLARWCAGELMGGGGSWPWATLLVNLVGAFCLGLLLEALLRRAPDRGWPRLARLHFGTGFLGSFTTMSALATEAVLLADRSQWWAAGGYLAVSLLGGVALAWCGVLLGSRLAEESA